MIWHHLLSRAFSWHASHRRFGPLFYGTVTVAVLTPIASIPFWQTGIEQLSTWRLAQRLHDSVEAIRCEAAEGLVRAWSVRHAVGDPGDAQTQDARVRSLACSTLMHTTPKEADAPLAADPWSPLRTAIRPFAPRRGGTTHSLQHPVWPATGSRLA